MKLRVELSVIGMFKNFLSYVTDTIKPSLTEDKVYYFYDKLSNNLDLLTISQFVA